MTLPVLYESHIYLGKCCQIIVLVNSFYMYKQLVQRQHFHYGTGSGHIHVGR